MKVKDNLSETMLTIILFDLTMSYVMSIKDTPKRHMMKQTFNHWEKIGRHLWTIVINQLRTAGMEEIFDNHVINISEVIRYYLESENPVELIALMKAHNEGDVEIKP